jgi:hypothetical protein
MGLLHNKSMKERDFLRETRHITFKNKGEEQYYTQTRLQKLAPCSYRELERRKTTGYIPYVIAGDLVLYKYDKEGDR